MKNTQTKKTDFVSLKEVFEKYYKQNLKQEPASEVKVLDERDKKFYELKTKVDAYDLEELKEIFVEKTKEGKVIKREREDLVMVEFTLLNKDGFKIECVLKDNSLDITATLYLYDNKRNLMYVRNCSE